MNKKSIILLILLVFIGALFTSCASMQTKPTAANFKAPTIALDSVQVTQYNGYWYYGGNIKPTKGKEGANSAVLPLAFTFNITNPNSFPVKLDGFGFTVAFEDFDVNMVNAFETQWIPPGKTNQISVPSILDVHQALLGLLVPNAFKVKERERMHGLFLRSGGQAFQNILSPFMSRGVQLALQQESNKGSSI